MEILSLLHEYCRENLDTGSEKLVPIEDDE
jgi:hypothetical protein